MRTIRLAVVALVAGFGISAPLCVSPAAQAPAAIPLPGVEPLHESGQDVTPAFEGWFKNPDGSFEMQFGYQNRNTKEEVDIPIGPNNRFEPGPADQGQPTHFMPRRGWGNFTVTVPKDFGTKKLTWTLIHAGRTNTVPGSLDARWEIDALKEATVGNTPPVIRFIANGPSGQGPKGYTSPTALSATVGAPLTLDAWVADDARNRSRNYRGAPVTLTWLKYRGPGEVKFAKAKPDVDKDTGKATTTATFSAAGEYTLRLQANDSSGEGGGGFQCCWTNGFLKVTVKDAGTRAATEPVTFKSRADLMATLAERAKATPTPVMMAANVKSSGDRYQINVVRRTTPQGAISHAVGSEIHSIIDGSATLVTGGTIVRPSANPEDRARGTIQNGVSRKVSKGDIILVPPGTPHWYPTIDGVVTYLEIRFDVGAAPGTPAVPITSTEVRTVLEGKGSAPNAPLMFSAPVARGDKFQANVVRRTKAQGGGAHELGTELHQILDGSGTLVTGGTVVRSTGANPVSTIEGGDSREVGPGDVVLIPANTPHWYKAVNGTITYLEVRFEVPAP